MIKGANRKFIRKDGTVKRNDEIYSVKGTKTTAAVRFIDVIKNDLELVHKSKGKFRFEYQIIAVEDNILEPLVKKSLAFDKAEIILSNAWELSEMEMFCSCLQARNGWSMEEIEDETGISLNQVKGAIRRSYDKSHIHKSGPFAQAFIIVNADYVLPVSLIWVYEVKAKK